MVFKRFGRPSLFFLGLCVRVRVCVCLIALYINTPVYIKCIVLCTYIHTIHIRACVGVWGMGWGGCVPLDVAPRAEENTPLGSYSQ